MMPAGNDHQVTPKRADGPLNDLDQSILNLSDTIDRLMTRLTPVLSLSPVAAADSPVMMEHAVRRQVINLNEHIGRLNYVIESIDL